MNKALMVALIVVVAGGVVAGLSVVGGPGFARMEKNDRDRARRLQDFGEYHACQLAQSEPEQSSETPTRCRSRTKADNPVDVVTGKMFVFERTSDTRFSVCAEFETDISDQTGYGLRNIELDGQTGCIVYTRSEADGRWLVR